MASAGATPPPLSTGPDPAPGPAGNDTSASASSAPGGLSGDDGIVILEPRFWVPLGVTLLGPACLVVSPLWSGVRWLTLALVLFGGFLLLQARLISLRFSASELQVWSGSREIRRFPYSTWLGWRLFWPRLPILFYFREQQSIHLLPVLFDAGTLREQLQQRLDAGAPSPTP
ncbi:MAG: DUF3119 family protein [Cyanobium sp.]